MDNLTIFFVLLTLGYVFGKYAEKSHYASINAREKSLLYLPTTTSKYPIGTVPTITHSELVCGSVVISVDYFKRVLAALRNIFGGTVQSYETLIDRARREAILRMKESCPQADQLLNLRIETSSISQGGKDQVGSVEVLAYCTAIYFGKQNEL